MSWAVSCGCKGDSRKLERNTETGDGGTGVGPQRCESTYTRSRYLKAKFPTEEPNAFESLHRLNRRTILVIVDANFALLYHDQLHWLARGQRSQCPATLTFKTQSFHV